MSVWGYIELKHDSVSAKRDIYESVPGEPCAILQINNLRTFQESLLYNNNYWLNLTSIKALNKTHILLATFDSLKESEPDIAQLIDRSVILAVYPDYDGESDYLLTSQMSVSEYEKLKEFTTDIEYYNEFLLSSSSDSLLSLAKSCIDAGSSPILQDTDFHKVRLSSGTKQEANIFLNASRCQNVLKKYVLEQRERLFAVSRQYDSWCGYDVDFSEDKIEINGFAYYNNTDGVASAFHGQNTERNTLSSAMPYNTFFFRHFSLSSLDAYRQLLFPQQEYDEYDPLETSSGESPETFFQEFFGGEIALGYSPLDAFVIIKLINGQDAISVLRRIALELNPESTIRSNGFEMFHIGQNGFAGSVFGSYFNLSDEYICISGNNMIITPSEKFTTYIATRNPKTQTLHCAPIFRSADRTLLSTSNRSVYIDVPYVVRNAQYFFTPEFAEKLKKNSELWSKFDCIGLQSESETNHSDYQHIFIQYSGQKGVFVADVPNDEPATAEQATEASEISEISENAEVTEVAEAYETSEASDNKDINKLFSVTLDTPATIEPQIFTNHYTGENEIFIQDTKNQIYLISAQGKILWKTSVKGQIIGGIKAVDMLKNKKLQIAFITKDKLYIIDRNGKMLAGFPKEISGDVCTPLSVFDYENNRDYRFAYGTADNKIHLIKKDGTPLNEWKNVSTKSNINGEIRHFRLNGKDYIAFADADKTYFLDRKANHRLKCGASLVKSNGNGIFEDISELKFVMSLSNGKICFVNTTDKAISTQLKNYGSNHCFMCTGKHYLFGSALGFDVYDRDLKLIFSDSNVKVSKIDAVDNVWGAYNSVEKNIVVYQLGKDGSVSKSTVGSAASNLFTISPLKPVNGTSAIICSGSTIEVYRLD